MSQQYDDYMAAIFEYNKVEEETQRLVTTLQKFAASLENWKGCFVDMRGQTVPSDMFDGRVKLSGDNIPLPDDIRMALLNHFQAKKIAMQAWATLSTQEQNQLKPPPWA